MSTEISRLTAADYEELTDFLSLVFSLAHQPTDFRRLLPAWYQPTDRHMSCQYAIRGNGRLQAIVGIFPIPLHFGSEQLRVAGVGGVATHPAARGQGFMQRLMHHCLAAMRAEGYQLSFLGGQRQRYGYFGYERCGGQLTFRLARANTRHHWRLPAPVSFVPLLAGDQRLAAARQLHDAQPVRAARDFSDFHRYLGNWQSQPYLALDPEQHLLGYLVANQDGSQISEVCAADSASRLAIVRAWVESRVDQATVTVPLADLPWQRELSAVAEQWQLYAYGMWQVFDWPATLTALLRLQRRIRQLTPGQVQLEIAGQQLCLTVTDADSSCRAESGSPALVLDAPTAMRLLFGPLPPEVASALPDAASVLADWCPLPLWLPHQDTC